MKIENREIKTCASCLLKEQILHEMVGIVSFDKLNRFTKIFIVKVLKISSNFKPIGTFFISFCNLTLTETYKIDRTTILLL